MLQQSSNMHLSHLVISFVMLQDFRSTVYQSDYLTNGHRFTVDEDASDQKNNSRALSHRIDGSTTWFYSAYVFVDEWF